MFTTKRDIYRRYKQINHFKKMEYCLQHASLRMLSFSLPDKIFQPILFTHPFQFPNKIKLSSEYVLKQH